VSIAVPRKLRVDYDAIAHFMKRSPIASGRLIPRVPAFAAARRAAQLAVLEIGKLSSHQNFGRLIRRTAAL
jgi:hypothetical protein